MGVVNTTYTFTSTDTITSAKMNNIIDDTTFTSDAIQGTTLQVVSPGKLAVSAGGITSNELASGSVVTAKIADSNITTAKIADANVTTSKIADASVTQVKLASNVAGNGPAFRATTLATTIPTAVFTNVLLSDTVTDTFDTNSNFASNTFTPTVAGYYQINGSISYTAAADGTLVAIYKNGLIHSYGSPQTAGCIRATVSDIVYLNGAGDFVNLTAYHGSGTNKIISAGQGHFSGCLIRSA